jgi:hypothetical protein
VKKYDPNGEVDPAAWLGLDESERLRLAVHRHGSELSAAAAASHAAIHTAVETQLAEGAPEASAALARLRAQGLSRHDAVHAVGSVLTEYLWKVAAAKHDPVIAQREYRESLSALDVDRWRAV